jgi:hypothetical protein
MTALADIRAAIDRRRAERRAVPLIGRRKVMVCEIGDVAAQAVFAELGHHPNAIEDVPLVRTTAHRGWAIEER